MMRARHVLPVVALCATTAVAGEGWSHGYDGAEDAEVYAVVATPDGGGVVVGRMGTKDGLVARVGPDGSLRWSRRDDAMLEELLAIGRLQDDGCVVVGRLGTDARSNQVWVRRLTAAGEVTWDAVLAGPGYDEPRSVATLPDDTSLISGKTGPDWSPFVIGLGADGRTLWQVAVSCPGGGSSCVVPTSDGGFLLVGSVRPGVGLFDDGLVVKFDASRRPQWQRRISADGSSALRWAVELEDGSFLAVGATGALMFPWLVKLGATGDVLVSQAIDSDRIAIVVNDVVRNEDGSILLAGGRAGGRGTGLWRLDATGTVLDGVEHVGRSGRAVGVARTPDGGHLLAGWLSRGGSGLGYEAWVSRLEPGSMELACGSVPRLDSLVPVTASAVDPGFAIFDPGLVAQPPLAFTTTRDVLFERPTCPPPEVQGLMCTRTGAGVALTWQPIAVDVDSYEVYRGTIPAMAPLAYDHLDVGACGLATPAWTDADAATDGLDWYYLVVARNSAGRGPYGFDSRGGPIPAAAGECP